MDENDDLDDMIPYSCKPKQLDPEKYTQVEVSSDVI